MKTEKFVVDRELYYTVLKNNCDLISEVNRQKELIKTLKGRFKGIKKMLGKCILPGCYKIDNWERFYLDICPHIGRSFDEAYNSIKQIDEFENAIEQKVKKTLGVK